MTQIVSGRFEVRFGDERTAQAAARDARCVGFVVGVHEQPDRAWIVAARRRDAFPADERGRYASRLHTIASAHGGGEDVAFVDDDVS